MNFLHHWLCRSDRWRKTVAQRVPWVLADHDLGPRVLELGPGPGLTTDFLRLSVPHLTALELDAKLAESLRSRLQGSNVEVTTGDATSMPFPDEQFSAVVSFTMLHHVPSRELQDKLFCEVWRVLKPCGVFVGSDSLDGWLMRLIHIGDTLVPIDPITFGARLTAIGFEGVIVERNSEAFRFHARRSVHKPSLLGESSDACGRHEESSLRLFG
jgi:SAM-dependent methyltransferase